MRRMCGELWNDCCPATLHTYQVDMQVESWSCVGTVHVCGNHQVCCVVLCCVVLCCVVLCILCVCLYTCALCVRLMYNTRIYKAHTTPLSITCHTQCMQTDCRVFTYDCHSSLPSFSLHRTQAAVQAQIIQPPQQSQQQQQHRVSTSLSLLGWR